MAGKTYGVVNGTLVEGVAGDSALYGTITISATAADNLFSDSSCQTAANAAEKASVQSGTHKFYVHASARVRITGTDGSKFTASNNAGSAEIEVTMTVTAGATPTFSFSPSTIYYSVQGAATDATASAGSTVTADSTLLSGLTVSLDTTANG